jgi:hypothetical protein
MWPVFQALLAVIATVVRSRLSLQLEVVVLRHQLSVYQRSVRRPRIRPGDRILWAWLSQHWSEWRAALQFVQPLTVIAWQQRRFRAHWARLSRHGAPGRPAVSKKIQDLVRRISRANPNWGSPRIVGELGNVTENPTAQWAAQQIVEAFPWDSAPKYLLRDCDAIFGDTFRRRVASLGIDEVLSAPRSPCKIPTSSG